MDDSAMGQILVAAKPTLRFAYIWHAENVAQCCGRIDGNDLMLQLRNIKDNDSNISLIFVLVFADAVRQDK